MQATTRRLWSTQSLSADGSIMEMLISFYSTTLVSAHSDKTTSKWFAEHDITVLDWPANMPEGREAHLLQCGGLFTQPDALISCKSCYCGCEKRRTMLKTPVLILANHPLRIK